MPPTPPFAVSLARRSAVTAVTVATLSTADRGMDGDSTSDPTMSYKNTAQMETIYNSSNHNHTEKRNHTCNRDQANPNPSLPQDGNIIPPSSMLRNINSNNSNSNGNNNNSNSPQYQPSVFRYTCRGRLTLDSRRRPHHAGICHGIQSSLEHVDQWRHHTKTTASEDEAIQWFQARAAAWNEEAAEAAAAARGGPGRNQATAAAASSSSGGGGTAEAHALQAVHMPNVLVYPTASSAMANDPTVPPSKSKSSSLSPPPPAPEEWSCYGTTEVDILVLRRPQQNQKSKEEEDRIAAVSPYCSPGMTIRDVTLPGDRHVGSSHSNSSSPTIKERTSTVRLGVLEILYQSSMEDDDEFDMDIDTPFSNNKKINRKKDSNTESTANGDDDDDEEDEENQKQPHPQPRPFLGFPTRFSKSAQLVWKHMQQNAHLIYEATQEDFARRTWEASHRVVQEFPKTRDRTLELIRRVIFWDWSSDDGDNDGPPPPPMT